MVLGHLQRTPLKRWATVEQGSEPPSAHMGPLDELVTHSGCPASAHMQLGEAPAPSL